MQTGRDSGNRQLPVSMSCPGTRLQQATKSKKQSETKRRNETLRLYHTNSVPTESVLR